MAASMRFRMTGYGLPGGGPPVGNAFWLGARRAERDASASDAARVCSLLQYGENAPVIRPGCASLSPGCEEAGITVTLPKPMTSNSKAAGRFGKQDFRYVAAEDVYVCPAGQRLAYSFTTEDKGLVLRRYWTNACQSCAIKHSCTTGKERLISRWEHEHILEAVQRRLD